MDKFTAISQNGKKTKKSVDKLLPFVYNIILSGGEKNSKPFMWKLSSAGRASALQAEGHRFEPYSFHQTECDCVQFWPGSSAG